MQTTYARLINTESLLDDVVASFQGDTPAPYVEVLEVNDELRGFLHDFAELAAGRVAAKQEAPLADWLELYRENTPPGEFDAHFEKLCAATTNAKAAPDLKERTQRIATAWLAFYEWASQHRADAEQDHPSSFDLSQLERVIFSALNGNKAAKAMMRGLNAADLNTCYALLNRSMIENKQRGARLFANPAWLQAELTADLQRRADHG